MCEAQNGTSQKTVAVPNIPNIPNIRGSAGQGDSHRVFSASFGAADGQRSDAAAEERLDLAEDAVTAQRTPRPACERRRSTNPASSRRVSFAARCSPVHSLPHPAT